MYLYQIVVFTHGKPINEALAGVVVCVTVAAWTTCGRLLAEQWEAAIRLVESWLLDPPVADRDPLNLANRQAMAQEQLRNAVVASTNQNHKNNVCPPPPTQRWHTP